MANKIKGITIQIGGDATGLEEALRGVNKEANKTAGEIKEIDKALKLDPSNTELLEQKQKALAKAVSNAAEKLQTLEEAQKQAVKQLAEGKIGQEQYDALTREIVKARAALDDAKKAASEFNLKLAEAGAKAGELAEKTEGVSKVARGMMAGIAAGFGASVKAYSDYEQLIGGIETMFKDAAGAISAYADQAYATAGVSANEYMEQVVSFSASLIQSLGGNTARAAEIANMAVIDMADNSNKIGTSMTMIQNAYQGFAKQNYTMLDNLKLGYGGTKTEMQRLLADAEKLTGIKYDMKNLSDVFLAIHAIQEELGITGTTAYEAVETIQGSAKAFKAAIENLAIGMARTDVDTGQLAQNVSDTFFVMADNISQAFGRIYSNMPIAGQLAIPFIALTAALSPVLQLFNQVTTAIPAMKTAITGLGSALTSFNGQAAVIVATFAILVPLLIKATEAWGDMTGLEKAVTVLGALVTAATAAAIALGAFQSAASMGIAAAAIVAGIVAITAAVNSANKRAARERIGSGNVPMMANGGILTQGSAIVGEAGPELLTQAGGRSIVQPLTNNYTTNYNTSSQPLQVNVQLDSQTMARALVAPMSRQTALAGGSNIR